MTNNAIALSKALLCSNCDHISDAQTEVCPHCGTFANWMSLAHLLGPVAFDTGTTPRLTREVN